MSRYDSPVVQLPKSIRLAPEAYGNQNTIFHIVFHALPGTAPFGTRELGDTIWSLITNERERLSIELVAACLMPDHAHFVAAPRKKDIISWVRDFKAFSTNTARPFSGRRAIWQPSFYDRALRSEGELRACVDYVLRNPVDARLASDIQEWPWVDSWWEG